MIETKLMNYLKTRTMWYHQEMNSIFYVESDCESVKLVKDKVNGLFMLK